MWLLYNLLFAIGYLVMLPYFLLRMWRRGGYRQHFLERFGYYAAGKREMLSQPDRIWLHAVSVGEAQLALALMAELTVLDAKLRFVVSTTTSTGYALLEQRLRAEDALIYYPLDFPVIVWRVLRQLRPRALVLLECELWPNLLRGLARRGIPVWVVNGRISQRSFAGYRKVRPFFRRAAGWVTGFLVQTEDDARRLAALGAERVQVLGSAKFDLLLPGAAVREQALAIVRQAGLEPAGRVWVMGSTWPGEEAGLLEVLMRLRERWPDLQAILVPRHAERGDAVARLLQERGVPYVRRTSMKSGEAGRIRDPRPVVLLADTTGELTGYYMLADVVFVGKSLAGNHGGQNPVEPAALGKPVVTGPNMENFPGVMAELLGADAIRVVEDFAGVERACEQLLSESADGGGLGARAAGVVAARRGVMKRSAGLILEALAAPQR